MLRSVRDLPWYLRALAYLALGAGVLVLMALLLVLVVTLMLFQHALLPIV